MKNLLIGLAAISALVFTSCKKDDPTPPENPVKNIEIPKSDASNPIKSTQAITLAGTGFAKDCELWLDAVTKADNSSIKAQIIEVTDKGVVFTATSASGEQAITLKQSGGEFKLGSIVFQKTKLVKKMTTTGGKYGDETVEYTYDNQCRLIKEDYGDNVIVNYEYSTDKIIEKSTKWTVEYTLENNRIVKEDRGGSSVYSCKYSEDGYLIESGYNLKYTWTGGNLSKVEKGALIYSVKSSDKPNLTRINIGYVGDMLGFKGKESKNLTSEYSFVNGSPAKGTYAYELDSDGCPTKITETQMDSDGNVTFTIVYTISYY